MGDIYQLSEFLLENLNKRDWTKAELARRAGLDKGVITRICNLSTPNPRPRTLTAIAKALNLPQDEIYTRAGIMNPPPNFDPDTSRLMHQYSLLTKEERQDVNNFVGYLFHQKKKKDDGNNPDDIKEREGAAKAALDH